jgi:hypothetical protein
LLFSIFLATFFSAMINPMKQPIDNAPAARKMISNTSISLSSVFDIAYRRIKQAKASPKKNRESAKKRDFSTVRSLLFMIHQNEILPSSHSRCKIISMQS